MSVHPPTSAALLLPLEHPPSKQGAAAVPAMHRLDAALWPCLSSPRLRLEPWATALPSTHPARHSRLFGRGGTQEGQPNPHQALELSQAPAGTPSTCCCIEHSRPVPSHLGSLAAPTSSARMFSCLQAAFWQPRKLPSGQARHAWGWPRRVLSSAMVW